jgi:drug/metabolite transporter (DMT)-like permease
MIPVEYQQLAFFSLALLAPLGYSLQQVLLSFYSRKMDGLILVTYRNLSFIITLSPLLFLSGKEGILLTLQQWPFLIGAGMCGAMGLSFIFESHKYLPLGIVSAFSQISSVLILLWVFLYTGEIPNIFVFCSVLCILIGGFFLTLQNNHFPHLNPKIGKGFFFVACSLLFGSGTFFLMSIAVQRAHPFASGYFWEICIGLFAFIVLFLREKKRGKPLQMLPIKDIGKIALFSFPTLLGSGALPLAMTLGNPGVAHSLTNAGGVIITIFLSICIHREKLKFGQVGAISIVLFGVVGMKMFSGGS